MSNNIMQKNNVVDLQAVIRRKKQKAIIIGVLVVLILAALAGYWHWVNTPQYTLRLIKQAVEKHDLGAFTKYVDLDTLVSRAVGQIVDNKLNSTEDEDVKSFAQGFVRAMQPMLVDTAKNQIKALVEKGSIPQENKGDSEQAGLNVGDIFTDSGGGSANFKGTEYVKQDGNTALVGIKLGYPSLSSDLILEFKMRKLDGYWQLAEISNLGEFLQKHTRLVNDKLAEVNKAISAELNKSLALDGVTMKVVQGAPWGMSQFVQFPVNVKNTGIKAISEFHAVIYVRSQDGKLLLKYPVIGSGNVIPANASGSTYWQKEINPFIKSEVTLLNSISTAKAEIELRGIKYTDGTEQKLADKL